MHKDVAHIYGSSCKHNCFRIFYDGRKTSKGAGGGWILYGASDVGLDDKAQWTRVAQCAFELSGEATVASAEPEAATWAI
eukprot:9300300-Karenia_brevis.AAC.1